MQALLGIFFHSIGGFASGSFYMPFKKVKDWACESYWIIGGLFSWLIVPPIAAWLTVPGFAEIIIAAVFDYYCLQKGVVAGEAYIADMQQYEKEVTSKR